MAQPTLLEFPCQFPIKVIGETRDELAQQMCDIVLRHVPAFDPATIAMKPSAQGKYLAMTFAIEAQSKEQLDALYRELSAHPWVTMVL